MRLKKIIKPLEIIGRTINKILTLILLIIVYFTSISITSIIGKTFGKKFLTEKSNWIKTQKNERYYQQF